MPPPNTSDGRDRYRYRFAPLLDYIRTHLRSELTVEELARVVHFSPYHFHRVYTAVMGETVGETVRRIRLERAVQIMRGVPGRTLGQIALEAGFSSASDFSRSFKRRYGVAPSRWNRRGPLVEFPAEPAAGVRDPFVVRPDPLPDENVRAPVQVEVDHVPACTLAFVRVHRPMLPGSLTQGCETLKAWLDRDGVPHGPLIGLSWDQLGVTPADRIRYDLACAVPGEASPPRPIALRRVASLRVATARASGSPARVAHVWDHLYMEWLPRSRHEPLNYPAFEQYVEWPGALAEGRWVVDCCLPLAGPSEPRPGS